MSRGKGFKRRLPPSRPSNVALGARTLAVAIRRGTYAVPPPAAPASPIDVALNTVAAAAAEKAAASSAALSTRGTEHSTQSQNALTAMQAQ